jgi:hypothetical protein
MKHKSARNRVFLASGRCRFYTAWSYEPVTFENLLAGVEVLLAVMHFAGLLCRRS